MTYKFDTEYTEQEKEFLNRNCCEILSEMKLAKTAFAENQTPRRMFRYGTTYIGEILDDEDGAFVWAILSRFRGKYSFASCFDDLESLEEGL